MKIEPAPKFRAELIKAIRDREFSERTGVHSSDLNYCLNKQALRKLNPKEDSEQDVLIYSLGWATQRWLTGKDEDAAPIKLDGITVTPDDIYCGTIWELKASYQSGNRPVEENAAWLRQLMAQCKVQGTLEAYLTRFELMGNWKLYPPKGSTPEQKAQFRRDNPRPTLSAYHIAFTQEEIDRNWAWFLGRKGAYEEILGTGELLSKAAALPPGGSYECDYCDYTKECKEGLEKCKLRLQPSLQLVTSSGTLTK